ISFASDAVSKGTIEVGGVTSVLFNKQTLTPKDPSGKTAGADTDITMTTVGVDGAIYITGNLGIGALVNYVKLKFESTGQTATEISGGYFGGLGRIRLPLGPKSDFVLTGAGGITQAKASPNGFDTDGHFWLAGGALDLFLSNFSSLDLNVSYQSSTFKDKHTP